MKRAIIGFHVATLVLTTTPVLAEATGTVGALPRPAAPALRLSIEQHQPHVRIGVQVNSTDRPAVATSTDIVCRLLAGGLSYSFGVIFFAWERE